MAVFPWLLKKGLHFNFAPVLTSYVAGPVLSGPNSNYYLLSNYSD